MGIIMKDWLLTLYYELSAFNVGVVKRTLAIDDDGKTAFCYYEKGKPVSGQASMVFIHGFSSSKEAWLPVIKYISDGYHSILIDLPKHGETVDSKDDPHTIDDVLDKLKMFLDAKKLVNPIYLIGASIGGTIVALFTIKYPEYISMICLLAPPPMKQYESELIQQLRAGMDHIVLPATVEEFYSMVDLLTVKKVQEPKAFVDKYFKSRLRVLEQQRDILKSFLEYEYLHLEQYYDQLKTVQCPALILWGRQDQLCVVEAAGYFSKLISDSQVKIFDECGHFIPYEKSEETAKNIVEFLDVHSYDIIEVSTAF
ncbi:unnamed protein product [Adineta ricciae]|uniref:acylglycerol lipase n=1 Tax=Adineta ricciae TaxID=249248 RepID=A0A813SDX9_ADIRI|nr:unnamed protein product [Adineta ricciae]CAF0793203.1 unnamed protein product [Adineta ricciae]